MVVIRNVFHCKPGKAKALVEKFKATIPAMEQQSGMKGARVMTDVSSTFWTVILETDFDSLQAWENVVGNTELRKGMEGYMDLVEGGHREIYRLE